MADNLAIIPGAETFVAPAPRDEKPSQSTKIYDLATQTWQESPTPGNSEPNSIAQSEATEVSAAETTDLIAAAATATEDNPLPQEKTSADPLVMLEQVETKLLGNLTTQPPEETQKDLWAYSLIGGNLAELAKKHPKNAALAEAVKTRQELMNNEVGYAQQMEGFFQQFDPTNPDHVKVLEDNMRTYANTFRKSSAELLPDKLRAQLQDRPEVVAAFDLAQLKLVAEHRVYSTNKGYEFAAAILKNPNSKPEARQYAQNLAKQLIKSHADALNDLGIEDANDNQDFAELKQRIAEFGLDDSILQQQTEKLIADANTQAVKETTPEGIDFISLLGLKDKEGNLVKGRAGMFAAVAALFILSDQFLAGISGREAVIPMLMHTVSSIGHEIHQDKYMAQLQIKDPATYAYYQRMGYGRNYAMKFALEFFNKQIEQRKAA